MRLRSPTSRERTKAGESEPHQGVELLFSMYMKTIDGGGPEPHQNADLRRQEAKGISQFLYVRLVVGGDASEPTDRAFRAAYCAGVAGSIRVVKLVFNVGEVHPAALPLHKSDMGVCTELAVARPSHGST